MENTIYIALSSQMALRRQLETVANNMANLSTPGYQAERMMFREYLQPIGGAETISFVQDYASYRDLAAGPLIFTDAPLDVAITGKGYFAVETPDGVRYTRAGAFTLDTQRRLVTSQGYPVQAQGGGPIVFPSDADQIMIADDGTISARGQDAKSLLRIGRLGVVEFEDERQLRRGGSGLFETDQEPAPATEARVAQGALETSNVQGVRELTDMMEILRTYQAVQKTIDTEGERRRSAIQQLSKTTA
ncbi:MAG: flagellar basal-body rod protein FlgF [Alphaproteobacteria bacterium]|nr:flagellar basal-body rod protein FlgF [Alphaproteobacteria bacterium]